MGSPVKFHSHDQMLRSLLVLSAHRAAQTGTTAIRSTPNYVTRSIDQNLRPRPNRAPVPERSFEPGEAVSFEVEVVNENGAHVRVDNRWKGYIPLHELWEAITPGEVREGYVLWVRSDGGPCVTLRKPGFISRNAHARQVLLDALAANKGEVPLGDASSPEDIRSTLGISKSDFKRAAGNLMKSRVAIVTAHTLSSIRPRLTSSSLAAPKLTPPRPFPLKK
eukprot:c4994_g1_i1.p1 GENE.c4994_g1_i1~~c4994_g1_i1.p1  ORF type:complete len:221 (-),score=21.32 c4994_g1_i1:129-791(-)